MYLSNYAAKKSHQLIKKSHQIIIHICAGRNINNDVAKARLVKEK